LRPLPPVGAFCLPQAGLSIDERGKIARLARCTPEEKR
jgi:hypothetical protein